MCRFAGAASTIRSCSGRRSIHAVTQTARALRPPTHGRASVVPIARSRPRASHPRLVKLTRIWRARWREQALSAVLAIQLIVLFAMPAARAAGLPAPHLVVRGLLLAIVVLVLVMARSRGAMAMVIVSVLATVAGSLWHHERPDPLGEAVSAAGQVLPQLALLWVVATAVFGGGRATYHRILGAVVMYLGIGMIFVSLDLALVRFVPGAFSHLSAEPFELREALTYFSFSTLTTSSFGDIVAVHPIARSLANIEAICGQLFPTILLARVVGLQGRRNKISWPKPRTALHL